MAACAVNCASACSEYGSFTAFGCDFTPSCATTTGGVAGSGVAVTGFFPTAFGFYATTVLKSLGFHYYETAAQSLALQWFDKAVAPSRLGRISAIASVATIVAYGLIFLTWKWFALDFVWVFLASGTVAAVVLPYRWMLMTT